MKRYVTEVVAQNIVLLGGNGNGSGSGADREEKPGDRPPARGRHASSRLERDMGPEEQGVQDDDIPF